MLGESGLRRATETAIVQANYVASALKGEYKVLYTGETGPGRARSDPRPAPFPQRLRHGMRRYRTQADGLRIPCAYPFVPRPRNADGGTTESEPKAELDRFMEALVRIKRECEEIRDGKADADDNVVKMAPHTAAEGCADDWSHPYGREKAFYPLRRLRENKFFPYVSRIDGGYGDRNLCCTCGILYETE